MTAKDIDELRKNGYKLTPQREAIWDALRDMSGHVTPQQLHDSISSTHPEIGLVTVYRTLAIFEEIGLICEIECGDGLQHYSLHDCHHDDEKTESHHHHHHHHLICSGCSAVIELDEVDGFDDIVREIEGQSGFSIRSHKLDFYGLCPNCQKGERNV